MILLNVAYAMSSGGGQTGQSGGGGMVGGLVTLGLIFLVFYFLLIRPQQKQQQKLQEMRNTLRAGEKVMTTGGIFGTVESISSDSVMLKIADKVRIEVAKNAIAGIREGTKKGGKE
ncbi:MAG: preprotein translocase subunit YajC [bacterium]